MTDRPTDPPTERLATDRPAERAAAADTEIEIDAPRSVVFAHLVDPRTYPHWLTGAQRIRSVDPDWPRPGSQFHHRVGIGPLHLDDATTVLDLDEPVELSLRASIGIFGSADVRFRLEGSELTTVRFEEAPSTGPVHLLGQTVGRWLVHASTWGRNRIALQNLKQLIERDAS